MAIAKKNEQESYRKALRWITRILNKNNVRYCVLGGLAAHAYGSKRRLFDIDLMMDDSGLGKILPEVRKHVVEMPHISESEHWRCHYMELEYGGITIEISGERECFIRNAGKGRWERFSVDLSNPTKMNFLGMEINLIQKDLLINYKMKLMRDVDVTDIESMG